MYLVDAVVICLIHGCAMMLLVFYSWLFHDAGDTVFKAPILGYLVHGSPMTLPYCCSCHDAVYP